MSEVVIQHLIPHSHNIEVAARRGFAHPADTLRLLAEVQRLQSALARSEETTVAHRQAAREAQVEVDRLKDDNRDLKDRNRVGGQMQERLEQLLAVIHEVHGQHGDDLCWLDIDRIFAAAGLPVPDRRVGDQEAMLRNCRRFVTTMCQGGGWKSYEELEAEVKRLEAERDGLKAGNVALAEKLTVASEHLSRVAEKKGV